MKSLSKKVIIGTVMVTIALTGTVFGAVKAYDRTIKASFANIKLIVDGKTIQTKAEPFIYNGNVYAPVATIANGMGIGHRWNNSKPSVEFTTPKETGQTIAGRDNVLELIDMEKYHKQVEYIPLFGDKYLTQYNGRLDENILPLPTFDLPQDTPDGGNARTQQLIMSKGNFPKINDGWFAILEVSDKGNSYVTTYKDFNGKRTKIDSKKINSDKDELVSTNGGGAVFRHTKDKDYMYLVFFNGGKIYIGTEIEYPQQ